MEPAGTQAFLCLRTYFPMLIVFVHQRLADIEFIYSVVSPVQIRLATVVWKCASYRPHLDYFRAGCQGRECLFKVLVAAKDFLAGRQQNKRNQGLKVLKLLVSFVFYER
jgi:hypothetical protein